MSDEKQESRRASKTKLADLKGKPLESSGKDIPPGTYAALLVGYGEPFELKSAEQYGGDWRTMFDIRFAIVLEDGTFEGIRHMVGVPDGGKVNIKSNLFKVLKAVGSEFITDEGKLKEGVTLDSFIGKTAMLGVGKNKKDFPKVESVSAPMKGAKFPKMSDVKDLKFEESENVPF